MAAVQQLRAGHEFVIHVYASYTGTSTAPADGLISEATWWSANGLKVAATITTTLAALRTTDMPAAGVGGAAIVIGETGYPTTSTRTAATQSAVVQAIVSTVNSVKATYGVTDLYFFDLRDGNTASGQLENGYGLLHDDYSPKPAFATLAHLIATVGV